jgi:hypothetical protein
MFLHGVVLRDVFTSSFTVVHVSKDRGHFRDLYTLTIPLQAWTGSEGSRRLRHPDFKTIST